MNVHAMTAVPKPGQEAPATRFAEDQLKSVIERVERLEEEKKTISDDIRDVSPAVHRQAEDRAHRMGQRDSVLAYYLVTDLGTDPFVMMTLNLKASQFTGLMQDKGETDDDRRDAKDAAKQHMEGVLSMLRGRK